MLRTITSMDALDPAALMAIYAESNAENGAYFFPELPPAEQIARAEEAFLKFLREEFFSVPGNRYYVLEQDGIWAAALRLQPVEDFFWLEALETRPDLRRRGCALALLRAVQRELGPCVIRDAVSRRNEASLRTHFAAGFSVENDPAVEYPGGETDPRCLGLRYAPGNGGKFEKNTCKAQNTVL